MQKQSLQEYSREQEEQVRKLWQKKNVPEKARKLSAKQKKKFYFMDGPPYATGHIHMGTGLNKIMKDVAIRSKRMQGYHVFDRPGYDTHGLPIENKVEEKLGFKSKQEIEEYGVKKFVQECRQYATQFIGTMNQEFNNLGVWMDWQNPYITLSNEYIDAIWWTFGKAEEKGLLYLGAYPVHACPRCATAVAYNEIEYVKQADTSIYAKFRVKGKENTFLIIWTTTPWTLPGNMGIMAHPHFDYVEAELGNGETWIIAKERLQQLMNVVEAGYTIKREFKGKELGGMRYENPIAKNLGLPKLENVYRVIMSERYVNLEDGTGLVHTAPGHGKEDFDAGTKAGLPSICLVGLDGLLTKEAGKYAGKKARIVDEEIISDLEQEDALVFKHPYSHDYPVCWRCKTPLLMISVPQWFFKITDIREKLLKENETVQWVPAWMKERMKNWLDQLGDWPISRARYWGTPLPIWVCEKCGSRKAIGSIKELEKEAGKKLKEAHKPEIDEIFLKCKCSGTMKRVPEVLDVWFDSGVSSWGALSYPENKKLFQEFWPADFNLEGTDQFRGWWNSQIICSEISFGKKPFKAIAVHGLVLDVDRAKMSKSKGNATQPKDVIEKYSRDYLRHYLISNSKGEDFSFDWEAFKDIHKFFNIFWNTCNYAQLYLKMKPEKHEKINAKNLEVEDLWILSRLNTAVKESTHAYNGYTPHKVVKTIEEFVMNDLSRTYIKLVRERTGTKTEKQVSETINHALFAVLKILSPITPHITEYLYQQLKSKKMPESIHLLQLPKPSEKLADKKLEQQMGKAMEIQQAVLALREQEKLRLRWPLFSAVVQTETGKELGKVKELLARMCNVKKVIESKEKPKGKLAEKQLGKTTVYLNTETTTELQEEWELMELRRKVQEMRKQADFNPNQKAKLFLSCSDGKFVKKYWKEIEKSTNTKIVEKKGTMEKLLNKEFFVELGK